MRRSPLIGLAGLLAASTAWTGEAKPYWLDEMNKINAEFNGDPGFVAQFGDSITYSMAFWSVMGWTYPNEYLRGDDGMPKVPENKRWRDIIKGVRVKDGSYSGWRVGNLLGVVEQVLKQYQPEMAIIMIGTNDISGGSVPGDYRGGLELVIQKCLAAKCIPILNTIPPRRGLLLACEQANKIVKEVAEKYKVPLVDYYAECLRLRPGDTWDGTLISEDGVHPTAGATHDFSPENLKNSGYALRNWLNFLMFREVYFRICSAPKPFVEEVGTVERVREGIRCPVIADTQVSSYRDDKDNERVWNWGKARRLKLKGFEEYTLMKFDTSRCKGMTVKRATLYLSRTEQCVLNVVAPTTISTDWEEGIGRGEPPDKAHQDALSKGGATYEYAIYPTKTWAGPGSDFKWVVFGEGGSIYGARSTGWAKDDKADYYTVELPLDVAQSLLVPGDSYGLALCEEKGQRAFQKTYRRVPNPNHFVNSRETDKPCFLVVEGEVIDKTPPDPVTDCKARPGKEAGDIVLSWKCTADDGKQGGKALGYSVAYSTEPLTEDSVARMGLEAPEWLPRYLAYRPGPPGTTQEFPIYALKPGTEYNFAVVAYDEVGNRSRPAIFTGRTREARHFTLQPHTLQVGRGAPVTKGTLRTWAFASNEKINPLTGNALSEGSYTAPTPAGQYREGNSVWDGKAQCVLLFAGRNDFAGFQLAVENLDDRTVSGLSVRATELRKASKFSDLDKYILQSAKDPAGFQSAMRELVSKDKEAANAVFAAVKRFNELKKKQADDPAAFFDEMEALRKRDAEEYDNWMYLLGGGQAAKGAGVIAAENVEIFWEFSLKDAKGNWYPDALIPAADVVEIPNVENRIPGQKVQAFYIDLYVPHETPPGQYAGDILIKANGMDEFAIPVKLTVWNFTLPDTLSFVAEMNGYGYPPFKEPDGWEGALNLHRLAHKNRLSVNMVPVSHSGNFQVAQMAMEVQGKGEARRVVSFENFDKYFGPLLTGKAFAKNPRANVPVAEFYLPFYENWPCTTKEGFTFDQSARHLDVREDFTPEYKAGWLAVARQFAQHLKEKGYDKTEFQVFLNSKYQYADDVTFWLLDEPMFRDDFLVIQMFSDLTREGFKDAAPVTVDFRIDCSRIQEAHGMMDKVDLLVGSMGNMRQYSRLLEDQKLSYIKKPTGEPKKVWNYGGTNPVQASNVANRAWATESYLFGCDGLLPWLAYGDDNAWESAENAANAVFYPAAKRWDYNGCYGSLRMKAFRDGQQDVEYLVLLSQQLGATRKELRTLLGTLVELRGKIEKRYAEDAGTISYGDLTPDELCTLHRVVGFNIHQTAK